MRFASLAICQLVILTSSRDSGHPSAIHSPQDSPETPPMRASCSILTPGIRVQDFSSRSAYLILTLSFELPSQELFRRGVGTNPALPQKEGVDFIGKNQLFHVNVLLPQALQQVRRLREFDISIVVSMDQQYRRTPGCDGGIRRRLEGQLERR